MLGWFQALMPREERFFQLFEKHATIVVAGAEALRGLLRGGDNIEACCKEIFLREAEADEVTREVLVAVRRTFITPFDRTDIQDLITSMDDAIDQMNKTAKTIVTFEVCVFEPCMQQMSEIIVQSAKLVLEAVPLLSSIGTNAGRLNALTTKIINVEEEAGQVYDRGLKALGWRIVHTVGSKITRLTPVQGTCAATAGAIMLFAATYLGIPVSTTHTVTGSVIGVGAARKVSAVRWNVATNIVIAWVITLPDAALMAAIFYELSGFEGKLGQPIIKRPQMLASILSKSAV